MPSSPLVDIQLNCGNPDGKTLEVAIEPGAIDKGLCDGLSFFVGLLRGMLVFRGNPLPRSLLVRASIYRSAAVFQGSLFTAVVESYGKET